MLNIFVDLLRETCDDLRTGELPKRKFIGKYTEKINKTDKANAFAYKSPQIVGDSKDPTNNWLDYMLGLSDEEYKYFKIAITNE